MGRGEESRRLTNWLRRGRTGEPPPLPYSVDDWLQEFDRAPALASSR